MKSALFVIPVMMLISGSNCMAQPVAGVKLSQAPFGDGPPPPFLEPGPQGGGFGPSFAISGPFLSGGPHRLMFNLPPMPPHLPPLPPGVELSDEQVEKFASLKDALREKTEASMVKIQLLEADFRKALLEPEIDAGKLNQLRNQINSLKETVDAAVSENLIAEAKELTAEQRKKTRMAMLRHEIGPPGFRPPPPPSRGDGPKP
jgi:hypothetical protein